MEFYIHYNNYIDRFARKAMQDVKNRWKEQIQEQIKRERQKERNRRKQKRK